MSLSKTISLSNHKLPLPMYRFCAGLYKNKYTVINGALTKDGSNSSDNIFNTWVEHEGSVINKPLDLGQINYYSQSCWQISDPDISYHNLIYGLPNFQKYINGNLTRFYGEYLFIYNLSADKYLNISSYSYRLPTLAHQSCVTIVNYNLFIIGGILVEQNLVLGTVQSYNIKNDSWIIRASLNINRVSAGCSDVNNNESVYVFGGYEGSLGLDKYMKYIEKYSISNDHWELLGTKLKIGRKGLECKYFMKYIFCVGGRDGVHYYPPLIEVFNPFNDSMMNWSLTLNQPRLDHEVIISDNSLLIIGGSVTVGPAAVNKTILDSIEILNIDDIHTIFNDDIMYGISIIITFNYIKINSTFINDTDILTILVNVTKDIISNNPQIYNNTECTQNTNYSITVITTHSSSTTIMITNLFSCDNETEAQHLLTADYTDNLNTELISKINHNHNDTLIVNDVVVNYDVDIIPGKTDFTTTFPGIFTTDMENKTNSYSIWIIWIVVGCSLCLIITILCVIATFTAWSKAKKNEMKYKDNKDDLELQQTSSTSMIGRIQQPGINKVESSESSHEYIRDNLDDQQKIPQIQIIQQPGIKTIEDSECDSESSYEYIRDNPDDQNDQNENNLLIEWLTTVVKLPQYLDVFISNGYNSLDTIKLIKDTSRLHEIGIKLKGHQSKIVFEIKKLNEIEGKTVNHTTNTGSTTMGSTENINGENAIIPITLIGFDNKTKTTVTKIDFNKQNDNQPVTLIGFNNKTKTDFNKHKDNQPVTLIGVNNNIQDIQQNDAQNGSLMIDQKIGTAKKQQATKGSNTWNSFAISEGE